MDKTRKPRRSISVDALYVISPALQGALALFCFQFEHATAGVLCALTTLTSLAIGAAKVSVMWK